VPIAPNPYDPQIIFGVPRITDQTVSALLCRDRRGTVRSLVRANSLELTRHAPVPEVSWRNSDTPKKCSDYLLDERQSLFVIQASGVERSAEAASAVKAMFRLCRREGHASRISESEIATIIPITRSKES
jgi:hypothetical protein